MPRTYEQILRSATRDTSANVFHIQYKHISISYTYGFHSSPSHRRANNIQKKLLLIL